jgi:hypothetical protein
MLAADKGALCLTMSALDRCAGRKVLRNDARAAGNVFQKGLDDPWCGELLLLPVGFAIQAVGLLQANALPHWQSALFLIGVLLVATPDGMEIINLSASILMATAMIPYQLIATAL